SQGSTQRSDDLDRRRRDDIGVPAGFVVAFDHLTGLGADRSQQSRKYVVVQGREFFPPMSLDRFEYSIPHPLRLIVAAPGQAEGEGAGGVAGQFPGGEEALSPRHPPEDEGGGARDQ